MDFSLLIAIVYSRSMTEKRGHDAEATGDLSYLIDPTLALVVFLLESIHSCFLLSAPLPCLEEHDHFS